MAKETSDIYQMSEDCLEESAAKDRFSVLETGADNSSVLEGKDAPVAKPTHDDWVDGNVATQVESEFKDSD